MKSIFKPVTGLLLGLGLILAHGTAPAADGVWQDVTTTDLINDTRLICGYNPEGWYSLALDHDENAEPYMICDLMPSDPAIAPDKNKVAYLAPYAFEEQSTIYIFDVNTKTITEAEIPAIPARDTPKQLTWLDNETLLVVAGFTDGTVTMGGNLYYYRLNGQSGMIMAAKGVEINKTEINGGNVDLYIAQPEYYYDYTAPGNRRYVGIVARIPIKALTLAPAKIYRLIEDESMLVVREDPKVANIYRFFALAGWLNVNATGVFLYTQI